MPIAFTGDNVAADRHASGLLAHWKGPNFAYDYSGNGNRCFVNWNGTSVGPVLPTFGGPHSNGGDFTAASSMGGWIGNATSPAAGAANLDLRTWQVPFTICAWARSTSSTTQGSVFSQYRATTTHRLIRILGLGTAEFAYYYSTASGGFQSHAWSTVPGLNVWHFIWAVVDGTLSAPTVRLGLNGDEQTFTGAAMSTTPDMSVIPFIGATNSSGGIAEMRIGQIGSIRLYKRALSSIELRQIMSESSQSMSSYARGLLFIPGSATQRSFGSTFAG